MLVALLLLSNRCIVPINVLWLLLTVPWVGFQCVIVVYPDNSHLLFENWLDLVVGCKKVRECVRKYHNHTLQTNQRHR